MDPHEWRIMTSVRSNRLQRVLTGCMSPVFGVVMSMHTLPARSSAWTKVAHTAE